MPSGPTSSEIKKFTSQTLKKGSKGPAVGYLQNQLNENGAKIQADNDFGAGTKKAVVAFQKKKKLDGDGIVGPNTWAAIAGKSPPKEKPDPKEKKESKGKQESDPNARKCTINVKIVCPDSGQLLQGANVKIGKVKEKTATKGDATLAVAPGRYTAEITKKGYEPVTSRNMEIRAIAGGTLDLRLEMKPKG